VTSCSPDQARSEEEAVGLQTQLDMAGEEVERAHARLAALELEKERGREEVPGAQPIHPFHYFDTCQ
jgi:hypothetical protein